MCVNCKSAAVRGWVRTDPVERRGLVVCGRDGGDARQLLASASCGIGSFQPPLQERNSS